MARSTNFSISAPPNAAMASWIRGIGQVVGDDHVDVSGSAGPDDDRLEPLPGLRVEAVARPARDHRLPTAPTDLGPRRRRVGALGVEGGQVVGVEAGGPEDREDGRPLGPERPRPAGEADLLDAERCARQPRFVTVQFRPESSVSGAASMVTRAGRAPRGPGRRPARGRRSCSGPVGSNDGGRPAALQAAARGGRPASTKRRSEPAESSSHGHPRVARSHRSRRPRVVRPGTWYERPGRCAARPTIDAPDRDEGAIALATGSGVTFCLRRPAIEPGNTWGVGHGTGTVVGSRRFESGIPGPVHEPSNWIIGQQAW